MNKADPFGDMTPASGLVSGDETASGESDVRAEEPVQADNIGAFLCATRMRAGGDLQEIAKILRIRYGYLVAIEDGRHEDLPGSAYSIGFVRAYADYLGLDGNEVVRRLREETDGTVKKARFEFPMPSGESGLPNGGLLAIAMAMGMVVYGSWYTMTNADRDAVDLIQEVPGRLAVLIQDENTTPQTAAIAAPAPLDQSDLTESVAVEVADASASSALDLADSEPVADAEDVTPGQPSAADVVETIEQAAIVETAPIAAQAVEEREPVEVAVVINDAPAVPVAEPLEIVSPQPEPNPPVEPDVPQAQIEPKVSAAAEESPPIQQVVDVPPIDVEVADVGPAVTREEQVAEASTVIADLVVEETPVFVAVPASKPDIPTIVDADVVAVAPEPEAVVDEENIATEELETSAVAEVAITEIISDGPLVIELRAKSDSWIQVRDGNELLLTRLLREGEVYEVPDRMGLTLMTGNAGGLEVFVDGELMPPLGDVGMVRRGVPLSAEQLRSGVAPS